MKQHRIKLEQRFWESLFKGDKTQELRYNDRDYQVGDVLHFVNIAGCEMGLSDYIVTHILTSDTVQGLEKGYCILSIKKYIP